MLKWDRINTYSGARLGKGLPKAMTGRNGVIMMDSTANKTHKTISLCSGMGEQQQSHKTPQPSIQLTQLSFPRCTVHPSVRK